MARFLVVVPADLPDVHAELTEELSGEDVGVIVDRRQGQRRERRIVTRPADRRQSERRGKPNGAGAKRPESADARTAPA